MYDFSPLERGLSGRYALVRELGRGGAAAVFEAKDQRHERVVALKILRPEIASAVGSARFAREIKLTASLSHPHILPLYDSGEVDGYLYYVMPLIEGESLRARLEREKHLAVHEAIRVTTEIAEALGYAHEHGLVHRDVKPENILLQAGHALVADFGIAVPLTGEPRSRLTPGGFVVGTAAYMSPEQASGEPRIDGRSDQYALACVCYEMLAGKPLFAAPNSQAVIAKRFTESPPALSLPRKVPTGVRNALSRALALSPDDRFPGMREFAAAVTAPTGSRV